MKLECIKAEKCETCGSKTIKEAMLNRHCNGQYNERRWFECGAILHWSPNFKALYKESPCPNSDEEKKRKEELKQAKIVLNECIENLNIDGTMKASLISVVKYV